MIYRSLLNDIKSTDSVVLNALNNEVLLNDSPIEETRQVNPGDVKIESISLVSDDGQRSMNISGYVKLISIYESVMSPVIFCEMEVADSIDLLQTFPIIGEETIRLVFSTTDRTQAEYIFSLNKVRDKSVNDSFSTTTYTLELVSEDLLKNAGSLVSRRLEAEISSSVVELLTEELRTNVPIAQIEPTKGIDTATITRLQPLKAIDYLRGRAISLRYNSNSFAFFRTRKGYHFVTLEKLIDDGSKTVEDSDRRFFFDNTSQNHDMENMTVRNIIAYSQVSFADTISKITTGGTSNIVNEFDMITGKIERREFKFDKDADYKFADKAGVNTSGFARKHSSTPANILTVPFNSLSTNSVAEKALNTSAFITRLSQNIVRILIYGDTELNVGDMIYCDFIEASGMTLEKEKSRLDSGNYLITKIRHMILNGDRPQHIMSLELVKGSFNDI